MSQQFQRIEGSINRSHISVVIIILMDAAAKREISHPFHRFKRPSMRQSRIAYIQFLHACDCCLNTVHSNIRPVRQQLETPTIRNQSKRQIILAT